MKSLYYLLSLLLFVSWPSYATDDTLQLVEGGHNTEIAIEDLQQQAKTEFTIFAPFRGREVKMRGILLDEILLQHLSKMPKTIKLIAADGYEITFNNWRKGNWIVVTYEDDKPLTIRQQGPLRLIERNDGNKDPENLRNFNDWVWMLVRIEVIE